SPASSVRACAICSSAMGFAVTTAPDDPPVRASPEDAMSPRPDRARLRRGRAALATALGLAVSAGAVESCSSSRTEIVVVVDGDVTGIDTVTVTIEGAGGFVQDKTVRPGIDAEL